MKNERVLLKKVTKSLSLLMGLIFLIYFAFGFMEAMNTELNQSETKNVLPFSSIFSASDHFFMLVKNVVLFTVLIGIVILLFMGLSAFIMITASTVLDILARNQEKTPVTFDEQLRLLRRKKPHQQFVLKKSNELVKTYVLEQYEQQWTLTIRGNKMDITMVKDQETLIYAQYDVLSSSFVKKNISAEFAEDKIILKQFNKYLNQLVNTNWKEPHGFRFISSEKISS